MNQRAEGETRVATTATTAMQRRWRDDGDQREDVAEHAAPHLPPQGPTHQSDESMKPTLDNLMSNTVPFGCGMTR